jgi:hypothetical protein
MSFQPMLHAESNMFNYWTVWRSRMISWTWLNTEQYIILLMFYKFNYWTLWRSRMISWIWLNSEQYIILLWCSTCLSTECSIAHVRNLAYHSPIYFLIVFLYHIYIYVWKLNQTVLELDFRAVKFLFFPRRDLNPHHWYTAAPFA